MKNVHDNVLQHKGDVIKCFVGPQFEAQKYSVYCNLRPRKASNSRIEIFL